MVYTPPYFFDVIMWTDKQIDQFSNVLFNNIL